MRPAALIASAILAVAVAACADGTGVPDPGPLAGLVEVARNDTTGTTDSTAGPGYFRGVVLGYTPGGDTLSGAVRLQHVAVAAYPRLPSGEVRSGPPAASVSTDANGEFTFPTLAGGEYAVTFTPPAASPYRAGWTVGTASPTSGDRRWWIMLPRK